MQACSLSCGSSSVSSWENEEPIIHHNVALRESQTPHTGNPQSLTGINMSPSDGALSWLMLSHLDTCPIIHVTPDKQPIRLRAPQPSVTVLVNRATPITFD